MSQIRGPNPTHDPFKCFGLLIFHTTDYLTTALRGALLIFLVASISLVVYSGFMTQTQLFHCPECSHPTQDIDAQLCDETHNVSGRDIGATNISHLVFGIGGSAKTWNHRRHYCELWWRPNITRGYVWLDEKPDPKIPWSEKSPEYRVSEDWTRFKFSSSQSAVRIARIVLETIRLGLPDVRWFVMGDDDTVFFTDNLVSVLARYDHRSMYYIGGNSESVEQDVRHSYDMAFGGGGFAISYGLALELVKVFDGCLDRYYYFYGSDQRVSACVNEIGVSLTVERGFHQFDIRGDPYGLLAAHPMTPLVSLHHLDAVDALFPGQTQPESLQKLIQAYRVDPAQTIQQSICYDHERKWSVSISWGYTAQIYPSLLSANRLVIPLQTFKTWRSWSKGPFIFNTQNMKSDICEQPVKYFLDKVEDAGPGHTLTSYEVHLAEGQEKCSRAGVLAVKRIVILASKMNPQGWNKMPRRRCCEISGSWKNTMKVKIRSCKQSETITT